MFPSLFVLSLHLPHRIGHRSGSFLTPFSIIYFSSFLLIVLTNSATDIFSMTSSNCRVKLKTLRSNTSNMNFFSMGSVLGFFLGNHSKIALISSWQKILPSWTEEMTKRRGNIVFFYHTLVYTQDLQELMHAMGFHQFIQRLLWLGSMSH